MAPVKLPPGWLAKQIRDTEAQMKEWPAWMRAAANLDNRATRKEHPVEPVKVTLPPWRRGDGKPCKEPGSYATRVPGFPFGGTLLSYICEDHMDDKLEFSGPLTIEFIETEPEPLTLPGLETRAVKMDGKRWCVRVISEDGYSSVVSVVHENKATAIEAFNAAVRALEGK